MAQLERVGVHARDRGESAQALKRRAAWTGLSFRKPSLMVRWEERTGSGRVFIGVL